MAILKLLKLLRPQFWPISLVPGLVGIFLSRGMLVFRESILVSIILIAGSGLAEVTNEYIDRDLKKCQTVKKFWIIPLSGGSGVVISTGLTKRETLCTSGVLVTLSLVGASLINVYVLSLTLIGLVMAIGYSLKPLRLKSRGGLGLLDMALGRGFVSFHIGWLAFSFPTMTSIAISVFLSLLMFGTVCLAQLADYIEDKELDINTFPVQVGFEKAVWITVSAIIMPFLLITISNVTSLVSVNILMIVLALTAMILVYLIATVKTRRRNISRLQMIGIILFCLAPFVFI